MIIANPLYDIIFKRLMENKRIARYFVETLIEEHVEEIAMMPQEYTYYAKVSNKEKRTEAEIDENTEHWEVLSLIRFDFVATIRNSNGEYKKVLIEIQKSSNPTDLMRFRTYLGEQYKRMDVVEIATGKVEKALPIISIYLLGFTLPEIDAVAVKVGRTYIDMIEKKKIEQKSSWIESLTHDGYFVQIPKVKGNPRTSLEKLLSIFEQKYFINEKNTIKEYDYIVDDDNVKNIVEVLRHAASDAKTKREMEEAWWADLKAEGLERELQEVKKEIEESNRMLSESNRMLEENKKTLEDKDKEIAELKRLLGK